MCNYEKLYLLLQELHLNWTGSWKIKLTCRCEPVEWVWNAHNGSLISVQFTCIQQKVFLLAFADAKQSISFSVLTWRYDANATRHRVTHVQVTNWQARRQNFVGGGAQNFGRGAKYFHFLLLFVKYFCWGGLGHKCWWGGWEVWWGGTSPPCPPAGYGPANWLDDGIFYCGLVGPPNLTGPPCIAGSAGAVATPLVWRESPRLLEQSKHWLS